MSAIYIQEEITINANKQNVWDALTQPSKTAIYMFGCEIKCNWQIGSDLLWVGMEDGNTYVNGKLLKMQQYELLSFTVFPTGNTIEDIPENHLTVTYTLEGEANITTLKVHQGDFSIVAHGKQRLEETNANGGWLEVLKKIKHLVE